MSGLKPGDRALVIPHVADIVGMGGTEVTLIKITDAYPDSTAWWGTMWEVDWNGLNCTCAQFLLRKIEPPKPIEDFEDTDTPDKKVSWDNCPFKPNLEYVRNWEYKETT